MTKVLIGDREKDKKTYRFKLVGLFLIAERGLGTPGNMGKPRVFRCLQVFGHNSNVSVDGFCYNGIYTCV